MIYAKNTFTVISCFTWQAIKYYWKTVAITGAIYSGHHLIGKNYISNQSCKDHDKNLLTDFYCQLTDSLDYVLIFNAVKPSTSFFAENTLGLDAKGATHAAVTNALTSTLAQQPWMAIRGEFELNNLRFVVKDFITPTCAMFLSSVLQSKNSEFIKVYLCTLAGEASKDIWTEFVKGDSAKYETQEAKIGRAVYLSSKSVYKTLSSGYLERYAVDIAGDATKPVTLALKYTAYNALESLSKDIMEYFFHNNSSLLGERHPESEEDL